MDEFFMHEREWEEGMWPASQRSQPPEAVLTLACGGCSFFSETETKGDI